MGGWKFSQLHALSYSRGSRVVFVAGSKHPPRLTLLVQMPKTGETSLAFFKFSFMFKVMFLKGLVGYKLL